MNNPEITTIKTFDAYTDEIMPYLLANFAHEKVLTPLEIDYDMVFVDGWYALRKDDTITCVAKTSNVTLFGVEYLNIEMIYLPLAFRQSHDGKIMIHGIKEIIDLPIICYNVLGTDIVQILSDVTNHYVFTTKTINMETGELTEVEPGDITHVELGIIVVNRKMGLFLDGEKTGMGENLYWRVF